MHLYGDRNAPHPDLPRPGECPLCGGATAHAPFEGAYFDDFDGDCSAGQREECSCDECEIVYDVEDQEWRGYDGRPITREAIRQARTLGPDGLDKIRAGMNRNIAA